MALDLKLAVVETCGPEGCQVTLVEDDAHNLPAQGQSINAEGQSFTAQGQSFTARYSAMLANRMKISPMKIYPGQLVAIDMGAAQPEITWRWHRARVLETSPQGASLEDPAGRRIEAVWVPGLESSLARGDEVWITGFGPTMEIHARIINNRPSQLEQLKELVLPRVAEQIASLSAK